MCVLVLHAPARIRTRTHRHNKGDSHTLHKAAVDDIAAWNACVQANGQARCLRSYSPQQLVGGGWLCGGL